MRKLLLPLALLLSLVLSSCVSAPPVAPETAPGAGDEAAPAGGTAEQPAAPAEGAQAVSTETAAVPAEASAQVPASAEAAQPPATEVSAAPAPAESPPPADPAPIFALARKNFDDGYPNTALEKLREVTAIDPAFPGAKLLAAKIYHALGDSQSGLPLLSELISKGEGGPEALDTYVRWSEKLGKSADAAAFLEKLSAEFPQPPDDLTGALGWCYFSLGDYPKAVSLWEKIGDAEESMKYALILAKLHHANGDLAQAERRAREAMNNKDPLLARQAKLALADVFLAKGRASSAKTLLDEIVAEAPSDYEALNSLGLLGIRQEKPKEAKEAFQKAIEANPSRPEAFSNLGLVLRSEGDHKGAEESYRKALAVRPDFAPALKNLAVLYEKYMGRFQDAVALYEKYLAARPADEEAQKWLKAAQRQAGGGQ